MRMRIASKVLARWARGEGKYTDNRFGVVLAAHRKVTSYYARRGYPLIQFKGLPYAGIPQLPLALGN